MSSIFSVFCVFQERVQVKDTDITDGFVGIRVFNQEFDKSPWNYDVCVWLVFCSLFFGKIRNLAPQIAFGIFIRHFYFP